MNQWHWIGLTGGIASGKSTVSQLLRGHGYAVVDADELAREVVKAGTEAHNEIVLAFGPGAVSSSGELDRKRIGEIVFQDRSKLTLLESIIHPRVRALAEQRREELKAEGRAVAFYDVPLLFEKKMEPLFDRVVVVATTPEVQLIRLMARDGLSQQQAEQRLQAQIAIGEKVDRADYVIWNNGAMSDLERAVGQFVASLPAPHIA